jgi:hypothetical protein
METPSMIAFSSTRRVLRKPLLLQVTWTFIDCYWSFFDREVRVHTCGRCDLIIKNQQIDRTWALCVTSTQYIQAHTNTPRYQSVPSKAGYPPTKYNRPLDTHSRLASIYCGITCSSANSYSKIPPMFGGLGVPYLLYLIWS